MRHLLTVHGISTEGLWQEELEGVLGQFFICVSVKYPHYRRLGLMKLLVEPWVFFPMVGVAVIAWRWGIVAFSVVCILGMLSAHVASYLRRYLALKCVKEQLTPHMRFGQTPHIVAHSLGTYLVGRTLKKFEDPRATHIVFAGCVLGRGWDWLGLKARNRFSFQRVRNEVGMRDWVARLAYLLGGLIPGFGMAGFAGFHDYPEFIHTIDSGNLSCSVCAPPSSVAPIHNVRSREGGHSDAFISVGYATAFWLPYLWEIDPPEYQEFLGMCLKAAELEEAWDIPRLTLAEGELRETEWRWCEGRFDHYVERVASKQGGLGGSPASVASVADLAVRGVWRLVAAASTAAQSNVGGRDKVRALYPPTAVAAAVEAVVR